MRATQLFRLACKQLSFQRLPVMKINANILVIAFYSSTEVSYTRVRD